MSTNFTKRRVEYIGFESYSAVAGFETLVETRKKKNRSWVSIYLYFDNFLAFIYNLTSILFKSKYFIIYFSNQFYQRYSDCENKLLFIFSYL